MYDEIIYCASNKKYMSRQILISYMYVNENYNVYCLQMITLLNYDMGKQIQKWADKS
jgi:hypothetical protein